MIEAVWNVAKAALLPINLPFTVLIAGVAFYWLLVVLGTLDFEFGGHDVDLGGGDGADAHAGHGHEAHADAAYDPGVFQGFLQFLHIGDAPVMVVLSVMAIIAWVFAMLANILFNSGSSLLFAAALLVPNAIFTVVSTHYIMRPVAKFIRSLNEDAEKAPPVVGLVAEVTTSEVTAKFGLALVQIKGAPLAIQIRNTRGEKIGKGERVLVIDEDKKNNTFEVVKYNQTELEV